MNTVLMNIERKYCNEMLKNDVEKIIDAFGNRIIVPRSCFRLTLTRSFVAV